MARLFKMLLILFLFYLLIQFSFKYFGTGHNIKYHLDVDGITFNIEEIFVTKTKGEKDSYYFNISVNDTIFSFQTYEDFKKMEMLIKDIKYFENDNYKCILPIFYKDRIIMDMMCLKNSIIYNYHDIKGKDQELDMFVNDLNVADYDIKLWENDTSKSEKNGPVTFYVNNVLNNHYVGVNSYKGIYTFNHINKKIGEVKLFSKDVYKRNLEALVDNYYVVADYNLLYEFSDFRVVNIINDVVTTIKSNKKISFDSYIQGVVDKSIYLYDRSNKKQYEVDLKAYTVLEVGNADTGIKYYDNGEWNYIDISELATKDLLFSYGKKETSSSEYDKIDTLNYEKTGYTYYYKKTNNGYDVYRAPNRNLEIKTYLFSVNQFSNVKYIDDFIFLVDGDLVKYYHDKTGLRTLFRNEEFDFNENLKYNVYIGE